MSTNYLERIQSFTESDLPDLDEVVMGALTFLSAASLPRIDTKKHKRPLVVGSVGGLTTAKMLFNEVDAVIADEGTYNEMRARVSDIDAVYIVSASGSKHAVQIAKDMTQSDVPIYLITSTENAPAAAYIPKDHVFIFPHIREPYTYNTSTYLGMLLGSSEESAAEIMAFIETNVAPQIPNTLNNFSAFVLTVPPHLGHVRSLFLTKFDELLAPIVTARSFTSEEIKHAKLVVPSSKECVLNFGVPPTSYVDESVQITIPLPEDCGYVTLLAIGYYVIGRIQKQHPPYFKEHIKAYTKRASEVFSGQVPVIVE
jgi:hypothetical protein